jgi:glycosyltransferase involved in cell wall biosynthesis
LKEKLKIALVVSHPIQHFCPQYVSFAENKNIEFKVFFASRLGLEKYMDENFKQEISWGNLNLHQFDHQFLNGDAVLQSDKNIDAPLLHNALDEYKPDVVICYGYFQKLQRRANAWAKKNKVAIAYISDSELRHKQSRLKSLLKYPFLKNYFSGINYFFTVGDANEAFYAHYGVPKKKMMRMHFPIDIKTYEKKWAIKDELRKTVREQFNIGEEEIVLSVVGKLVSWKNQDHIIDAMLELEKEKKFFHLFIIGSGEMMELWKQKAVLLTNSKVHFTGFVNIDELPAYYAATDIYVHPAAVEPHSIAISEAVYMGCPVIISDSCGSYGYSDDVQRGKNGYVYSYGDIAGLADCITLLSNNAEMRNSFCEYSHSIAVKFQEQSHFGIMNALNSKI